MLLAICVVLYDYFEKDYAFIELTCGYIMYADLSNDDSSGGSNEDSLTFLTVTIRFTQDDINRGFRTQFLSRVDAQDWHTEHRDDDGVTKVWRIMESDEFEIFVLWLRGVPSPVDFVVNCEYTQH